MAPSYKYNRLTGNDTNWGPLTIGESSKTWRPVGITLCSGGEEYTGASLNLYTFGRTIRLAIPAIIKPWKVWIDTSRETWSKNPAGGYWDIHECEYGFRLSDGFLQVFYGAQTHDSSTDHVWCTHLPWTNWRHVRHSYYGLSGEHFWTEPKRVRGRDWDYKAVWAKRDECPVAKFQIKDYDGEVITASTRIEEGEMRFGTKWCKWLSLFRKARIHRSLHIDFDKEVGTEKGSWKGGMMGHGIEMLPGELHEDAFRRYCEQPVRNKYGPSTITYMGRVD